MLHYQHLELDLPRLCISKCQNQNKIRYHSRILEQRKNKKWGRQKNASAKLKCLSKTKMPPINWKRRRPAQAFCLPFGFSRYSHAEEWEAYFLRKVGQTRGSLYSYLRSRRHLQIGAQWQKFFPKDQPLEAEAEIWTWLCLFSGENTDSGFPKSNKSDQKRRKFKNHHFLVENIIF